MKSIRIMILAMMMVLVYASAYAKTVSWAISPKYDKITRYGTEIFVFEQNGKWGVVKPGNIEAHPATFDFILPFTNGYALAGLKERNRYLLKSIIGEDGEISDFHGKLYLPMINRSTPHYFSEGKLAVTDANGKYGYVDTQGQLIIGCQFDNALPFKEGWAPVRQGDYMKYINDDYDRNPSKNTFVVDDFHYGEMTVASCFSNGKAVIAYNDDYALIGKSGKKIGKLKKNSFVQMYNANNAAPNKTESFAASGEIYEEYYESGKYGYGLRKGESVIVTPQFDSFSDQFSDGYVIAGLNGKQGLLSIVEGDYELSFSPPSGSAAELVVSRKGKVEEPMKLSFSFPLIGRGLKLLVDCGNGHMSDLTSQLAVSGNNAQLTFSPKPVPDAKTCVIRVMLENDGIVVAHWTARYNLVHPIRLRVSAPGPSEVWANEKKTATFSSTIYNDSNKPVTVTATWSIGGTPETVTIPAHGRRSVTGFINVTYEHSRDVRITLSTGESSHNSILFHPFF